MAGRGKSRTVLAMMALQQGETVVQGGGQVRGGAQGLARAHAFPVDDQHLPALAQQAGGGGQPRDACTHHHHVLRAGGRLGFEPASRGVADRCPDGNGECSGHAGSFSMNLPRAAGAGLVAGDRTFRQQA